MSELSIKIEGLDKLTRALDRYPSIAEPILQRAIEATSAVFASKTLKDNPIPWRTGNLLHSFRSKTSKLESRWYPTARYAIFVHEGTSRGIKPNRFMIRVMDNSKEQVNKLFIQALDLITREIANAK